MSRRGGVERTSIVHRIGGDTSGLLVVAKNDTTHLHLTEQLQARTMIRVYEAFVYGVIDHEDGMIDAPIGRYPNHRVELNVVKGGRPAVSRFEVLERYD